MRRWTTAVLALLVIALGMTAPAHATSPSPTGGCRFQPNHASEPNNWGKDENWSCGHVPGEGETAIIDTYVYAYGPNPWSCFFFCPWGPVVGKLYLEPGAELSTKWFQAKTVYLQGGSIFCETDCSWTSGGKTYTERVLDATSIVWDSGMLFGEAETDTLDWGSGDLRGRLKANAATLHGDGPMRIDPSLSGKLSVWSLTFGDPSTPGADPAPLEIDGDGVGLSSRIATFTRNWTVTGWGDAVWDAGSVRVLNPGIDASLEDLNLEADAIGIAPTSRVLMSGGSLTPTDDSNVIEVGVAGPRAFLGCNMPDTGCMTASAPSQDEAGRLETGVPAQGQSGWSPTQVNLPTHWAMHDVVWAPWSGTMLPAIGIKSPLASVEPLSISPNGDTNAWVEWYGGTFDRASFPGAGPAHSDNGVDIDILGDSPAPMWIKNMVIGSDAVLSMTDPLNLECDGSLTIASTGSMTQYPGSYLGGCNDQSQVENRGTWSVINGPDPAQLAETKFTNVGNLDLTDGSLEVSDLYNASIRGTATVSWNSQAQLLLADSSPITLGTSRKPLNVRVDWVAPVPVEDDYFLPIWEDAGGSHITGNTRVINPNISPGLIWSSRLDNTGLIVEAAAAHTVRTTLAGCTSRPCTRTEKKSAAFTVSWDITTSHRTPGLGLTINLPAQTQRLATTGMTCTGQATLTCTIGTVPASQTARVSLRLINAKAGTGLISGSVRGQGLAGDLSLEPVSVKIK